MMVHKILIFLLRIRFSSEVKKGKYVICSKIGEMDCDKFILSVFAVVHFGIILVFLNIKIHKLDL